MTFDTLTTGAIRLEVEAAILGGRVQKVVLPDAESVGLEVYANRRSNWLLLSISNTAPRVHLVSEPLRRGVLGETPLLNLLRKYVRGGLIESVTQPPLERVLAFNVASLDRKTRAARSVTLVAEVIGRYSNLILVDSDGTVMDSLKRVGPGINRYRQIVPHRPYRPPPPLNKPHPTAVSAGDLASAGAGRAGDPAWRILVDSVSGISPLLAREVLHRACGDVAATAGNVPDWNALIVELQRTFAGVEGGSSPATVAFAGGTPVAFAPYELRQFAVREGFTSISAALERYYAIPQRAAAGPLSPRRQRIRDLLLPRKDRHERRIRSLNLSLERSGMAGAFRHKGELILAHLAELATAIASVTLEGEAIDLDPNLKPVANAQAYFKRYRSAKAAAKKIPELARQAGLDAQFVEQALLDLQLAVSERDVAELERALAEAGIGERKAGKSKKSPASDPEAHEIDGWEALVGRNAAQNDTLTFRIARSDDLWLHARGVPGAHVILRTEGREAPEPIVRKAAAIAARWSAVGSERQVEVDATLRKNVRRIPGGRPGQVSYRGERTLRVAPVEPADPAPKASD